MSTAPLNGHAVAVCIPEDYLRLVLPDGTSWKISSTPLQILTEMVPADTVLGFTGLRQQPRSIYHGLNRKLTRDEVTAEAIFVPLNEEYVVLLRAVGFRGQILSPGVLSRDWSGEMSAYHHSVVVLADAV